MPCHCCCQPEPSLTEFQRLRLALMEVHEDIREMKQEIRLMADQSALLTSIADGLRGLGAAVATLRDENITLRARNAELEGEDVAESAATDTVKTEYDNLAGLLTSEPSAPDVEPLPEPEEPADPSDGGEVSDS